MFYFQCGSHSDQAFQCGFHAGQAFQFGYHTGQAWIPHRLVFFGWDAVSKGESELSSNQTFCLCKYCRQQLFWHLVSVNTSGRVWRSVHGTLHWQSECTWHTGKVHLDLQLVFCHYWATRIDESVHKLVHKLIDHHISQDNVHLAKLTIINSLNMEGFNVLFAIHYSYLSRSGSRQSWWIYPGSWQRKSWKEISKVLFWVGLLFWALFWVLKLTRNLPRCFCEIKIFRRYGHNRMSSF